MQKIETKYFCDLCRKEIIDDSAMIKATYRYRKLLFYKNNIFEKPIFMDICKDCSKSFVDWMHERSKLND